MHIGITGHQQLDDPSMWPWVSDEIRNELLSHPLPFVGISSLAIGADQLFSRLVLSCGGKLRAVLPYRDIERSFSPEDLPAFKELVASADVEVLKSTGSDEDAYLAAGLRIADEAELMVAVWNGLPAKGKGGTADVVEYVLKKSKPIVHINPRTRTVQYHGH